MQKPRKLVAPLWPLPFPGIRFCWLLALGLLAAGGGLAPARAQAPNVKYSPPLTITKGGTYSGNYRSTDSKVPCIRITTTEPVIIENCILAGAGDIILGNHGGYDLVVRKNRAYGLRQSQDNTRHGRFLEINDARRVFVENNYFEHTTGIAIYQWTGNGSANQTLRVVRNMARNIDGRYRNGGGVFSNFLGTQKLFSLANVEIAWNQIINEPDQSLVEDNFNFYNSGGTAQSPLHAHDNYVQGAYPYPATSPDFSGSGLIVDGTSTGTQGYVDATDNQFVSTCNSALNIASGHHVRYRRNRMVTSGLLPTGQRLLATYCGIAVFNAYQQPTFGQHVVDANVMGVIKWGRHNPLPDRNDEADYGLPIHTNTQHLPNPVTLQTERDEWTRWLLKLQQNNVQIGPDGMSPAGPAAPVVLPGPANATFVRGININGAAVQLDGHPWEAASGAANLSVTGTYFTNPASTPTPAVDAPRAAMLTSAVGGTSVGATLRGLASGTYSVYAHIWEDNGPETTDLLVNGRIVRSGYNTGAAGHWERLGPFRVEVGNGQLVLITSGGHPNLSGVELWKHAPVNQAPTVVLSAARGDVAVNSALSLTATAADADGSVTKVEFFSGTTKLGEDTTAPYAFSFTPTTVGSLSLSARATDNHGATTTSTAVSVSVKAAASPAGNTTFFRAINLNGAALSLDGNTWPAGSAGGYSPNGVLFANQNLVLTPSPSANHARMIRSAVYSPNPSPTVNQVPSGNYTVFAHVREDNHPEQVSLRLNGEAVLTNHNTGPASSWRQLRSSSAAVTEGTIRRLTGSSGYLHLPGLEI